MFHLVVVIISFRCSSKRVVKGVQNTTSQLMTLSFRNQFEYEVSVITEANDGCSTHRFPSILGNIFPNMNERLLDDMKHGGNMRYEYG